jgi:hypothetical protein
MKVLRPAFCTRPSFSGEWFAEPISGRFQPGGAALFAALSQTARKALQGDAQLYATHESSAPLCSLSALEKRLSRE